MAVTRVGAHAAPGRPRRFSREQVVAAAIEILETEGHDGLTMKAISARLGTGVGTLYSYAAGKEEIMTLVAEDVTREVRIPSPDRPWDEFVSELVWSVRDAFKKLRWVDSRLLRGPEWGEAAKSIHHAVGCVLRSAGFDHEERVLVGRTLLLMTAAIVLGETPEERLQPRPAAVASCIETVIAGMRARLGAQLA